jgi:hypothetical protein
VCRGERQMRTPGPYHLIELIRLGRDFGVAEAASEPYISTDYEPRMNAGKHGWNFAIGPQLWGVLRIMPSPDIRRQRIGLRRSPSARLIGVQRRRIPQYRIYDRPRRFHRILPHK